MAPRTGCTATAPRVTCRSTRSTQSSRRRPRCGGRCVLGGRPVLTAIYLCGVCSCQEPLRRHGRGQATATEEGEGELEPELAEDGQSVLPVGAAASAAASAAACVGGAGGGPPPRPTAQQQAATNAPHGCERTHLATTVATLCFRMAERFGDGGVGDGAGEEAAAAAAAAGRPSEAVAGLSERRRRLYRRCVELVSEHSAPRLWMAATEQLGMQALAPRCAGLRRLTLHAALATQASALAADHASAPLRRPPQQRGACAPACPGPSVSRSCACIGSPCLRHCVHGAPIGGGGGGRPAASGAGASAGQCHGGRCQGPNARCCCCGCRGRPPSRRLRGR
jgi:hypothetical protein